MKEPENRSAMQPSYDRQLRSEHLLCKLRTYQGSESQPRTVMRAFDVSCSLTYPSAESNRNVCSRIHQLDSEAHAHHTPDFVHRANRITSRQNQFGCLHRGALTDRTEIV